MRLAPLLLLIACSEYDIKPDGEPVDTPVDSETTAPPPPPPDDRCPTDPPPDPEPAEVEECRGEPTVGEFDPVVEWEWRDNPIHPGYDDIMATPAVADISGDGVPDVVFSTFAGGAYTSPGALVAISGADGSTLFSLTDLGGPQPYGCTGVAIADLEGDGVPEILFSTTEGLAAVDPAGALRWVAATSINDYGSPAVGDLDADGVAEVVYGPHVVDAWGGVMYTLPTGAGGGAWLSFPFDLDNDGLMEIITGTATYNHDGSLRWSDEGSDGAPAVGDLDGDGVAEVLRVASASIVALSAEGAPLWTFPLTDGGGGPPTVADFDGDGLPEVGVASREVYRVVDGDGTELWQNPVQDFSSSVTGSSVFDFEGDGAAEVVYADELTLWVYDGATGSVELAWAEHASGTLYEYPLIVDLDADGAAEIVVPSNDYTFDGTNGITVLGDASSSWAAARTVWNQHAYHIANIADDLSVPVGGVTEKWATWNSFRAGNSETALGLGLPELELGDPRVCTEECDTDTVWVWVPVFNAGIGQAEDVQLSAYRLDTFEVYLRSWTVGAMPPGTATWVGPLALSAEDFGSGGLQLVIDDDGTGTGANEECDEEDNAVLIEVFPCDS